MFISKPIHILETYDPYGIHRLNGIKVVYVFFMLSVVNMFFYIPHPYFYFFYLPLTSMVAEVMMERIEDKYRAFVYTIVGACGMIILFDTLSAYPLFFPAAIFLATLSLYFMALRHAAIMLPLVPIILSLAAYSLLYPALNMNFKMVIENIMTTLFSMLIILASLVLFPLSYYYRLWLRAFRQSCQGLLDDFICIYKKQAIDIPVFQESTKYMIRFSNMLPRKLPVYTILKINLLLHQVQVQRDMLARQRLSMPEKDLVLLIQNLRCLTAAIDQETRCEVLVVNDSNFIKLINAWNYICSRQ